MIWPIKDSCSVDFKFRGQLLKGGARQRGRGTARGRGDAEGENAFLHQTSYYDK